MTGKVAGQALSVPVEQAVPEPDLGNFFLASMIKQWQADKDHAALIRADRALAFALQQNQLARAEYMTQGEWALGENRYDVALRLFDQARQVDPHNPEAQALVEVVQQLKDGKLTKEELREHLKTRWETKSVQVGRFWLRRMTTDRRRPLQPPRRPACPRCPRPRVRISWKKRSEFKPSMTRNPHKWWRRPSVRVCRP